MSETIDNSIETHVQKEPPMPIYDVHRRVILKNQLNTLSGYDKRDKKFTNGLKRVYSNFNVVEFLLNLVPILRWLPKYSLKTDLIGDLTAGFTVGVMHIPQGMAYALLAGISPSCGLYMAFFPNLVYAVFGTSRHISVGTLSVVSLMTLKLVQTYSTAASVTTNQMLNSSSNLSSLNATDLISTNNLELSPIQVVTATTFMCGIVTLIMCFLNLGTLALLLSESLVSSFTCATAVHVLVSLLKDFFGVKIPIHKGAFQIIYTVIDWIQAYRKWNIVSIITALIVLIFMIFMTKIVKPIVAKKTKAPIPSELIAIIGGIVCAYAFKFEERFNMHLVGYIPLGLPVPEMPPMSILPKIIIDCFIISIVSYSVTISMVMIFSKKLNYEVSANQELFALGISNIVGSFFMCLPNGTAISRSIIQEQTGGKTQIASVVSALLILIILLWIGPIFELLPRCVLAAIIIVALEGVFLQIADIKQYWKEGKMETFAWLVTFFGVVLIDVDYGLILGICVSVATLYIKGWKSQSSELGVIPNTNIYVNLDTHRNAVEVRNAKIFHYTGAINFASRASFKKALYDTIKVDANKLRSISAADHKMNAESESLFNKRTIIIDLSSVTHIDIAACKTFTEIQKEMAIVQAIVLITSPNDRVFDAFQHSESLGEGPFTILPSIHDAVLFADDRNR